MTARQAVVIRRRLGRATWISILALLLCGYALGQTTGSEIDVTVKDSTGAVLADAKVEIRGSDTGSIARTITTGTQGFAAAPLLRPGNYDVVVEHEGFKKLIQPNIVLNVGAVVRLELTLEIGGKTEAVTVTGQAPLVNATTGTVGQVVGNSTIESLPLNGRNYLQLGLLSAGTVPSGTREGSFATYGLRGMDNVFMLDGSQNVSYMRGLDVQQRDAMRPSIEAIEEFKVQTSNYSAQYGSSAGAVVSAVTKGGTNEIHGSVFEYMRNDALDARDYFATTGDKPKLIQNQFGGSLGGPIKKDKAWLFGAYQGTRVATDNVFTGTVPTPEMKNGNFGSTPIYNPYSTTQSGTGYARTQFANNTIPSSMFDPIGYQLVQLFPDPNLPGTANNYQNTAPAKTNFSNATFRGDVQLTSKSSMFGRLSFNLGTTSVQPALPVPAQPNVENATRQWSVGYGFTHAFNPTLINEFRFGWNRIYLNKDTPLERDEIIANSLAPGVDGTPIFTPTGYLALGGLSAVGGGALPTNRVSGVFDFSDNLSKIIGKHSIKVGVDYQYARISDLTINTGLARGSFSFTGNYTQDPMHRTGTGSGIADLLLGLAQSVGTGTALESNERSNSTSVYFQDDWSVTSRLTLNLGMRYDVYFPVTEIDDKMSNFVTDPTDPNFGKLIYAGLNGISRSLMSVDKNNIAPRVGFAYRLPMLNDFVVRGAYGIFFANPDANIGVIHRMVNNPPFAGVGGLNLIGDQLYPSTAFTLSTTSLSAPPPDVSPEDFVLDPTSTSGLVSWPSEYTSPYVQEWNLSIEKQLPGNMSWEVTYVGNIGTHLWGAYEGNQPLTPGPGSVNTRRPLAQYTVAPITVQGPWARSHYQGLSSRLEKRMSHGISFLAAFTHGRAIDMMSAPDTGYTSNISTVQDSYNRDAMIGLSDFGIPNRFVFSGIWQLPFGQKRAFVNSGWASKIVGNWDVSGIWVAQDGSPFTLRLGSNTANVGTITWPNRICNGKLDNPTVQGWYDQACFPSPDPYTFGNAGRNILYGPGTNNVNFSLARQFPLPFEGASLQFRSEFYNLFNHPSFGLPNAVIGVPATGTISGTNISNREVQFALRIVW